MNEQLLEGYHEKKFYELNLAHCTVIRYTTWVLETTMRVRNLELILLKFEEGSTFCLRAYQQGPNGGNLRGIQSIGRKNT